MSKNTKLNIALTAWTVITATATKTAYDIGLSFTGDLTDALAMSLVPALVTFALSIALTIRLTK